MKNVLFVTYDFPYPPTSGGKSRAFNLLKYSIDNDINMFLFSFVREDYQKLWNKNLEEIGVKKVYIYKRKNLKSFKTLFKNLFSKNSIFKTLYYDDKALKMINEIVKENDIDVIHYESSYTGYLISQSLKKIGVKQILGTENIEYSLYKDYIKHSAGLLKGKALSYQVERLKKEEEEMMMLSDLCLAVTPEEAEKIEDVTGKKCHVIENAVSIEELRFSFQQKIKNTLLFVGNFTYIPNIKAGQYFIEEVLPKFNEKIKLIVIGKKANDYFKSDERVIIKEFVDNLDEEYRNADCLVFPIKIGGGTNFKLLEAMALGTPVVGFAEKIENIGAREYKEFYPANNADDFLVQYQRIIADRKESEEIARNARKLIEEKYTWEKVGRKLNKIWKELANE